MREAIADLVPMTNAAIGGKLDSHGMAQGPFVRRGTKRPGHAETHSWRNFTMRFLSNWQIR